MDDDTLYILFLSLIIIIAGSLVILWLQMEYNTSVIGVEILFNVTPSQTVAIATNTSGMLAGAGL
jgi:hypothetical protein